MMPIVDPHEGPRTKWTRRAIGASSVAFVLLTAVVGSRFGWWPWVGCVYGVLATCAAVIVVPALGYRPRSRGKDAGTGTGSGLSWRGRDDDGPVGVTANRWRMLVTVSRVMPPSAGRRWLAEAESLLSEITAARRAAAVRSFLRSAPRLVVMMWAREALRRARLGPRRPG